MLDKKDLEEIIDELATENKIYSNEAQFQFDLAWKIKKSHEDYDVVLEYLWKPEKWYIDIVVFYDNKCVPIELKYKTTDKEITYNTKNGRCYTFNQGAPDTGSYDYIKDIYRIENLGKSLKYKGVDYTIECGYAIIITNDSHYYNKLKEKNKNGNYYYWENFSLAQEQIKNNIYWINPKNRTREEPGNHTDKSREHEIILKNKYALMNNWKEYVVSYEPKDAPKFKYLITQITTEKKK